jgi:adenylosuccinate lyase
MALVKAGADRQKMHGLIRKHSLEAWLEIQSGNPNPLIERLGADEKILGFLPKAEVLDILTSDSYLGDVIKRAKQLADKISIDIRS